MKRGINIIILNLFVFSFSFCFGQKEINKKLMISGIYPHLAFYNNEGECGTGAVVPWADRLWAITYAPHSPYGSSDKLYEITTDLKQIVRPESEGGTPADRLIHKESNQLFIGPYAIDTNRIVRTISYKTAPGRYTGAARHLTDPASKIYIATMEEGFYEVDVNTMDVNTLYSDDNAKRRPKEFPVLKEKLAALPGWHGKGLYSGQGVLIFSNNGEYGQDALERFDATSGSLHEWDGKSWKLIRRNQFTEITGQGGIYGNEHPETDPIWTTGFDYKSVLLGVRQNGEWRFFRLPKGSYCYDGAHGWNTEWPRIRNIGTDHNPDYLMTMHGLFWKFPQTFSFSNTAGIRPRSAYLKVIGDFTRWNEKIVFGCDDSAESEFLNTRKAKGGIAGPGQSNSNLWFLSPKEIDHLGIDNASGYVWLREKVKADKTSEPFLFCGWENRTAWIKNMSENSVNYTFEIDIKGTNEWSELMKISVPAHASKYISFRKEKGEWIRIKTDKDAETSVGFVYTQNDIRSTVPNSIFKGIANIKDNNDNIQRGLLYSMGNNRRSLGLLASDSKGEIGFYEIDSTITFTFKPTDDKANFIRKRMEIPKQVVTIDKSSVLVVDDAGRRWRLPLGDQSYTDATNNGELRICREVATERDLFNCHGTFYELPAENADGYAKIRPIASHNLKINDYASFRGLLIISGIDPMKIKGNQGHIFTSNDGRASVWAGTIDDLWKLGKPVGTGGPLINADIKANNHSDPYLFGFYDKRTLYLSHHSKKDVVFSIEIDPSGDGEWVKYKSLTVKPNETLEYKFPESALGRWIRFSTDCDVTSATTWLEYK